MLNGTSDTGLGDAGDDQPAGAVSCGSDPRVDTYTARLEKVGTNGVLSFELRASDPAPPAKGSDTFVLQLTNSSGQPTSGELAVALTMPDHGHGTTIVPTITFDPSTQTYTVTPLYLFMPGVWRIQFSGYAGPADAGPPIDSVAYYFCIEG